MAERMNEGGVLALGALLLLSPQAAAQEYPYASPSEDTEIEARVWLDRGEEPLLQRGESVRMYYRASHDAYVGIVHIDTNGGVRLVFPRSPDENHRVRGGRDYRLLFPRSPYWQVTDDPGVGYFFIVASPGPLDFSSFGYSHYDRGWDISHVGRQVYQDPFVAMDEYVAVLVPDWRSSPYALDFVTYHVGARHEYPRFLCYDCHGFRPYSTWNPYQYACSSFRVVVHDDPYYYPVTRYSGRRVVYARPPSPFEPRFAFKERAAGEPAVPLVLRRASTGAVDAPGGAAPGPRGEPSVPRYGPPEGRAPVTGPPGAERPVPGAGTRGDERARPVLQRRLPDPRRDGDAAAPPPAARPAAPGPRGSSGERPAPPPAPRGSGDSPPAGAPARPPGEGPGRGG